MKSRSVLMIAAIALAFPVAAFAQSGDSKYCAALSQEYTKYAQSSEGKSHNAPPADVGTAMSKCNSDAASAIPVLEKALKDAKITLPPRT